LQRLALNEAERLPHLPFIGAMIKTVREATDICTLKVDLENYLSSTRINARTDDDKSITIVCRLSER
jgi:hypothetical protein